MDVPLAELFKLALNLVGAACALVFAFISWFVRVEVNRALSRVTSLETKARENEEFREWVLIILTLAGLTPKPLPPRGQL